MVNNSQTSVIFRLVSANPCMLCGKTGVLWCDSVTVMIKFIFKVSASNF
jgi:hypothetical protein